MPHLEAPKTSIILQLTVAMKYAAGTYLLYIKNDISCIHHVYVYKYIYILYIYILYIYSIYFGGFLPATVTNEGL